MNKTFTYVSAFAGIGGMTLGLKDLGGKGLMAWEYDPTEKRTQYAQDAHKLLHPEIPVYGDIHEAKPEELPDFDVFCFTPPCQAFSVAGKRGGFDDTRGTLTFEALRIANIKRPKILFMENVKGLVNHDKGNTMGTIIHAINEIGFTVDFTVLNSKYFDVAQNRERVYLVAIRNDLITPEPWNDIKGNTLLPKAKRRYQEEGAKTFNFDWPEQTEVRTRLKDFLEPVVDEKYYIDETKTAKLVTELEGKKERPLAEYFIENSFCQETNGNGFRFSPHVKENATIAKTLTTRAGGRMDDNFVIEGAVPTIREQFTFDSKNDDLRKLVNEKSPIMLGHIDLKGMDCIKRVYDVNAISPTLTTMGGGHREPKIAEEVRPCLTPFREEKRQNGPRFKEDGAEAHTITTVDRHGVAIGEYPRYRIRKLTPKECLRLQSVPDWAIDILLENFSDSRVYKFAGNGLTTNVIKAIGEKLLKYL